VNRRAILSAFSQQQALQLRQRLPARSSNESLNQYEFNSSLQGTDAGTARVYQDLVNSISNVYRMQLTSATRSERRVAKARSSRGRPRGASLPGAFPVPGSGARDLSVQGRLRRR
jgi:hypothetical protein